jgi:hypothetical protein
MKTILSSVLCIVLMSWSITGFTQVSFGDPDCGKWIKLNRQTDKAWLLGYLSGMNTDITNKNFLNKLDSAEQAFLFVDNIFQFILSIFFSKIVIPFGFFDKKDQCILSIFFSNK